jgi:hypothetical protein
VHVSRGAVREQNLHSTPNWRPEGEVKCTVLVHEKLRLWGAAGLKSGKKHRSHRKKRQKPS